MTKMWRQRLNFNVLLDGKLVGVVTLNISHFEQHFSSVGKVDVQHFFRYCVWINNDIEKNCYYPDNCVYNWLLLRNVISKLPFFI